MTVKTGLRLLVTGGCGFIGSHLVAALVAAGHEITVLDDLSTGRASVLPPGVQLVVGDIRDTGLVRRLVGDVEGCCHLAAIASVVRAGEDWVGTHGVNQTATVGIFDAARPRPGRPAIPVIYASSAAVYGDPGGAAALTERAPKRPLSAYGADKLGCELHAAVASGQYGVPTTGLRFFNVFGPRQAASSPYSGVISVFINRLLRGLPLMVNGDGRQTRDFIFVADVVRCLMAAMDTALVRAGPAEAQVFNVCTGRSVTVLALASVLGSLLGRQPTIEFAPARPGDIRHSVGDPSEATQRLGTTPRVTLEAGLKATVAWALAEAQRAAEADLPT